MKKYLNKISGIVLLLIIVISTTSCFKKEKTLLKYHLEQGKTYKIETQVTQTLIQSILGSEQKIQTSLTSKTDFKVIEIDKDSNYVMVVAFQDISLRVIMPNGVITFNSDNPFSESNSLSNILNNITLRNFHLKMSPSGKVLELEGLDELYNKAMNQIGMFGGQMRNQLIEVLSKSIGEKAFRANLESTSSIYSPKGTYIGGTWTNATNLENIIVGKSENSFLLTDLLPDAAKIKETSKISSIDRVSKLEGIGMNVKYNITGSQNGEYLIDRKSGWIKKGTLVQEISGEIEVRNDPKIPGMSWPLNVETMITTIGSNN